MPRVKTRKTSVAIDMTPMVDMAFLLVTFFILTTKFRPDEPVQVNTPTSTSTTPVEEEFTLLTITIANDSRVFLDLENKNYRKLLIEKMGEAYNIPFTEDEENAFATGSSIGMPMRSLKGYLALPAEERKNVFQPGIPVDTTESMSNELMTWIINGRIAGNNPLILIKGDNETNYPVVKNVIKTLQNQKVLKFALITSEEAGPTEEQ